MQLRDAMRKAASLIIEMPPEPNPITNLRSSDIDLDDLPEFDLPAEARLPGVVSEPRTVEQLVRDSPGPDLSDIEVGDVAPEITAAQTLDFAAIYRAANLPTEQFGAEATLEMLRSLPSELPLETRRVTVKAMLGTLGKNMGATPQSIVADASRKLAALQSFISFMENKSGETVAKSEAEIAELERQIDAHRTAIQNSRAELTRLTKNCEAEAARLDDVLEFFSLDEGASKYAPDAESAS